jgi:hypothetical protein
MANSWEIKGMAKKLDKSKKSNIKCEHCKYWNSAHNCELSGAHKWYYQRCKDFAWHKKYDD